LHRIARLFGDGFRCMNERCRNVQLRTSGGRSAWLIGALLLYLYAIFAMTLYMISPGSHGAAWPAL